jgi:hypothetical protein
MEHEQAQEGVEAMQAASLVSPELDAGNERERAKEALLVQMAEDEPAALQAPVEDSSEVQPEEPKKAKSVRGRVDHLNEQERRVVELTTKRGLSLGEAYRAVFGAETPAEPAAAGDAVAELDQRIEQEQARLNELKRQKQESKDDLAAYDQASEAYLEAREQIRELRGQRRRAVQEREHEAQATRQRAEAVAQTVLAEEYPDAVTPGTELYEACAEELDYLRAAKSPLMEDPQVQYKVARRMARTLGVGKAASAEAKPAVTPKRSVRPLPVGGTPIEPGPVTLERRVAQARSSHAMLELMREYGTPIEALMRK